jgi:hypothetical protein
MRDHPRRGSAWRAAMRFWLLGASAALALASIAAAAVRPFTATDLVLLERVSDPRMSPDGHWVAYQLFETDLAANRGTSSLWLAPVPEANGPGSEPHVTRPRHGSRCLELCAALARRWQAAVLSVHALG